MKTNKLNCRIIAFFFSALILVQSCAVYEGNYSLRSSVDHAEKVKLKFKNNEHLLFNGNRYNYTSNKDYEIWAIYHEMDSTTRHIISKDIQFEGYQNIVLDNANYYGVNDFSNRTNWTKIDHNDIVEVSKTRKQTFKKIIYQEGNYFGVPDSEDYLNLVHINENHVVKTSKYDPVFSVMASIVITPVVVAGIIVLIYLRLESDSDDDY
jgi:hypothetical protein